MRRQCGPITYLTYQKKYINLWKIVGTSFDHNELYSLLRFLHDTLNSQETGSEYYNRRPLDQPNILKPLKKKKTPELNKFETRPWPRCKESAEKSSDIKIPCFNLKISLRAPTFFTKDNNLGGLSVVFILIIIRFLLIIFLSNEI